MLSEQTIRAIEQQLSNTCERVFIFSDVECDLVVKRHRPKRQSHSYLLLSLVARLLAIPSLKPARALSGRAAQENELAKLYELKNLGIAVPNVELIRSDYFVMRKVGSRNLAEAIETASPEDAVRLWKQGLETLYHITTQNTNLSQAHARNFVIGDCGNLYAIDFEDNPKTCLGLLQAQVKDWLFYLSSTLWMVPLPKTEKALIVRGFLDKLPVELTKAIAKASRFGSSLRFLPSKRKLIGRDMMTMQTTAEIMHRVFHRKNYGKTCSS